MKFILTIELGNDAMQTYQNITAAVRDTLSPIRMAQQSSGDYRKPRNGDGANIRDLNGNTVGTWQVSE